jgi:Galactose-3-O-sulfotransferase
MNQTTSVAAGDPLIIFLHNLKTGGTTLRTLIARQYPSDAVHTVGGRPEEFGSPDQAREIDLAKTRVIQGHIPFGLHQVLARPTVYTTMLRDPVDRMASLYYFTLNSPTRAIHQESSAHLGSLEQFVSSGTLLETDNGQTRRLSGLKAAFGECSEAMLERAKMNIRHHFAIVGLSERFDESVILMKRLFGWRSTFYLREKVTQQRPMKEELPDAAVRTVLEYNQLDSELHRFAHQMLDQAIARRGDSFRLELDGFKRVNAELTRLSTYAEGGVNDIDADGAPAALLDAHAQLLSREAELQRQTRHLSRQVRHRDKELRSLRKELRSLMKELAQTNERLHDQESRSARRFGIW